MTRAPERPSAGDEGVALREALTRIKNLKPSPIGDTGFQVGPRPLLDAAQRIAREALRAPRQNEAEQALREKVARLEFRIQMATEAYNESRYCDSCKGEASDKMMDALHPKDQAQPIKRGEG